jgi:hypothetical protein
LPEELAGVRKQLSQVFGITNLQLLETAVLRVRSDTDSSAANGALAALGQPTPDTGARYQLTVRHVTPVPDESGIHVSIRKLKLSMNVPYNTGGPDSPQWQFRQVGFNTDIDIREGQKAVVGKAKIDGAGRDFILVVTARVLE